MKQHLPNATAVLVLGILSIISCCFYGIGVIFGVIALVLAHSDAKLYRSNPELYLNYSNLNIGRILSIIGIVLSLFAAAFFAFIFSMTPQERLDFQENLKAKAEQQENEE